MNIKINKDLAAELFERRVSSYVIGSELYGLNDEKSDRDVLVIYKDFDLDRFGLPNFHQFQYDDEVNNIDFVFTGENQFWKNLKSGDSTINADLVLFSEKMNFDYKTKLDICRSYKVIKSYLGFAKRDIKQIKGKRKVNHVNRGLYTAECLINGALPVLEEMKKYIDDQYDFNTRRKNLQKTLNKQFDSGCLQMYSKYPYDTDNKLEQLLIESNNIKEFKYV